MRSANSATFAVIVAGDVTADSLSIVDPTTGDVYAQFVAPGAGTFGLNFLHGDTATTQSVLNWTRDAGTNDGAESLQLVGPRRITSGTGSAPFVVLGTAGTAGAPTSSTFIGSGRPVGAGGPQSTVDVRATSTDTTVDALSAISTASGRVTSSATTAGVGDARLTAGSTGSAVVSARADAGGNAVASLNSTNASGSALVAASGNTVVLTPGTNGRVQLGTRAGYVPISMSRSTFGGFSIAAGANAAVGSVVLSGLVAGDKLRVTIVGRIDPSVAGGSVGSMRLWTNSGLGIIADPQRVIFGTLTIMGVGSQQSYSGTWDREVVAGDGGSITVAAYFDSTAAGGTYGVVSPDSWLVVEVWGIR